MIGKQGILDRAAEWQLRPDVVEKDYVLGWLLWGIGSEPAIRQHWVFKGGTCLKKCYIETYRFSEDLDFTVPEDGPLGPDDVLPILRAMLARVNQESGIDFAVEGPRLALRPGRRAAEGRVYYVGPRATPGPARVKLDLDAEERLFVEPEWRPIAHSYDDVLPDPATVRCYSYIEVFAEKLRAMAERGRPRDLYDIINLFRRSDLRPDPRELQSLLADKCGHKRLPVPTLASLLSSASQGELATEWENMLAHQLPQLPPFSAFWDELVTLFNWLQRVAEPKILPLPPVIGAPSAWTPAPTIRTWGTSAVEQLRFAAQNRLLVEFGYVDEKGRFSHRRAEPYSLRETTEGNVLVGVHDVNRDRWRFLRVDRIENLRISKESFEPRYDAQVGSAGVVLGPRATPLRRPKAAPRRSRARKGRRSLGPPRRIIQCPVCEKRFYRDKYDTRLREHKAPGGWKCSGRTGIYLGMTN